MKKLWNRLIDYCRRVRERFFKFWVVGAAGTLVDLGIIYLLNIIFAQTATGWLIRNIVQVVGYEGSVISNFLLSFFWVWKDRRGPFFINFLKYNLATALAFIVRLFFFNLAMIVAGFFGRENMSSYYLSYFFSIIAASIINFLLIDNKVFSGKKADEIEVKHSLTDIQRS